MLGTRLITTMSVSANSTPHNSEFNTHLLKIVKDFLPGSVIDVLSKPVVEGFVLCSTQSE